MLRVLVGVLLCFYAQFAAAQSFVAGISGTKGNLDPNRIYIVRYSCSAAASLFKDYLSDVYDGGILAAVGAEKASITFDVILKSRSAAANPATAPRTDVVSANIFAYGGTLGVIGSIVGRPAKRALPCAGEFFLSGGEEYELEGVAQTNTKVAFTDWFARAATLLNGTVDSLYPLFRREPPDEFKTKVTQTSTLLGKFKEWQQIFAGEGADPAPPTARLSLKVGENRMSALTEDGKRVGSFRVVVEPIAGLLEYDQKKFLDAYTSSAVTSAIDISGSNPGIRTRCDNIRQRYAEAGLRNDKDVAYLLYRRLLAANAAPDKAVACMGRRIALVALDLLNSPNKPIPIADSFKINRKVIDEEDPELPDSGQPHDRASLAKDVDDWLYSLGNQLQSSTGLRGSQKTDLLNTFADKVTAVDTTRDYKAISILAGQDNQSTELVFARDALLEKLKKVDLVRWGCAQTTRRDARTQGTRLYDPKIDSAIMVVAWKAKADETLDFNKTPAFGVHLLFERAAYNQQLHITKLIFEERLRDQVLAINPTCVQNTPRKES